MILFFDKKSDVIINLVYFLIKYLKLVFLNPYAAVCNATISSAPALFTSVLSEK